MNVQIVIPPAFQFNGGLQSFEIIMSLDFYSATWITTQNFDVFDLVTISVKTPIHTAWSFWLGRHIAVITSTAAVDVRFGESIKLVSRTIR